MEARELRIGNYVSVSEEYRNIGDLLELNRNGFEGLILNNNYDRIFPIPLTGEWLLKFGLYGCFKDIDQYENKILRIDFNSIQDMALWISEDEDTSDESDTVFSLRNIKYVHQLQNLIFALTGEELTLKTIDPNRI